jgi:hypothetical protein
LKQDPGEEAHFGQDAAAPDEVEAVGSHAAVSTQTIEDRDFDPAIGTTAEREDTPVRTLAQLECGEPGG